MTMLIYPYKRINTEKQKKNLQETKNPDKIDEYHWCQDMVLVLAKTTDSLSVKEENESVRPGRVQPCVLAFLRRQRGSSFMVKHDENSLTKKGRLAMDQSSSVS